MVLYLRMPFCQNWLLALLILQGLLKLHACPSTCKCVWKGGKQTVECINGKLITIPDGVDPGTQVLEFSENNLQVLPRERFQRMGLLHLQRIYLARCRISQIDDRAFKGLSNLVELDLSYNLLNSVPTETFGDYPSLMRLTFSGNPIQKIKTNAFKYLIYLTTLELSNCQIEIIEPQGFAGLLNLEWLKLDGNRLSNIQGDKTLPESLHGILLHHNPWQCDCLLMDLYSWLLAYNVPHPLEPRCVAPPRVQGERIRSLELDDLACLPDVSPTTLYLEIAEGKNVSLLCRVSAIPEARVSWWFQGRILQNDSVVAPGIHLYYFVEEGVEEKRSELLIFNTNTDDNGTFVCVAENSAGKAHSNYTIRIMVKEEPVVNAILLSYEYVLMVSAVCSVLIVLMVPCGIVCAVRCQRSRQRRRKKERSKAVALQHHELSAGKVTIDSGTEITRLATNHSPTPAERNGELSTNECDARGVPMRDLESHALSAAGHHAHTEAENESSVALCRSPLSLRNYALEKNPDLINDTGSACKERRLAKRSDGDGDDCSGLDEERNHSANNSYQEAMENIIHDFDTHTKPLLDSVSYNNLLINDETPYPLHISTLPRGSSSSRSLHQHHYTADVHLSPDRFLDCDGYPVDYGLPKLHSHTPTQSALVSETSVFYRTLPHNRPSRLKTIMAPLASPSAPLTASHSPTADIFSGPVQLCEHYSPSNIRYTVEGYPCSQPKTIHSMETHISFPDISYLPSPPAPYKGEPCNISAIPRGGEDAGAQTALPDVSTNHLQEENTNFWGVEQCDLRINSSRNSEIMNRDTTYEDSEEQLSQCCVGSQTNEGFCVERQRNAFKTILAKETTAGTTSHSDNTLISSSSETYKAEETLITAI